MKIICNFCLPALSALLLLSGCSSANPASVTDTAQSTSAYADIDYDNLTGINLSDDEILVNGNPISTDYQSDVYVANDIVFYLEGQDFTYGEGTEKDAHSQADADAHKVIHITAPGTYTLSGSLSAGQIAIDLGEDAKDDPEAVVNLILNNADITCSVAPAVIFYNVYECGDSDTENASKDVDTSKAGANVILADSSTNHIRGSYVARIYKSYELNEDGTEVVDSEKLHKYDGAFYSKMSMNIYGEDEGSGTLNIEAENEGLDSELHLTINGGNVNITSGNDGINTNEDEISVTTINGGTLQILVTGETGEGDGIDSNGWLVINGGVLTSQACSTSGDAGIDSDMGIHINGGTVLAGGNMLDRISESTQTYAVFQFTQPQKGNNKYTLKNVENTVVAEYTPENDFSYLIISSPQLAEGNYSLWMNDTQLSATAGDMRGGMNSGSGGPKPEGMQMPLEGELPEVPEGAEKPEMPQGERPKLPEGGQMPQGEKPGGGSFMDFIDSASPDIEIKQGENYFLVM